MQLNWILVGAGTDWEWHPKAFDPEYGEPLGPATYEGGSELLGGRTYTRLFSKCTVKLVCPAATATNQTCDGTIAMKKER